MGAIIIHAEDWFTISRGRVAAVADLPSPWTHETIVGQTVSIDGEPFTVRGVEVAAVLNPLPPFGLLVEPA